VPVSTTFRKQECEKRKQDACSLRHVHCFAMEAPAKLKNLEGGARHKCDI